ncbi:Uncharacterised protein [Mycobacteroides abscessus subsp. massiliense]|uniref:hypothetical protein n=1 Tax=Mycobacteroides abscessus TaxID=36809 RepID=UPI0009A8B762|nr:hypothetical protein [Mycobacteroides abscessus]SKY52422.1 Uncharacterised protein [Mycobacteroides abscessus subsp. massiliense]SKZ09150.1 Uncharacterised protein [Mycobacteroides abscessus subsp. massiliense]
MNLAMLLLTIATVILAAAAVYYGRRAVTEAETANTLAKNANTLARDAHTLAAERSHVKWQVGRQEKDNAGWFYLMNIGEDPAHDVKVVAWTGQERVEAEAAVIVPFFPDQKFDADPPGYIDFRLPKREANGPKPISGPRLIEMPKGSPFYDDFLETQREVDEMVEERQRHQVGVRVSWRSAAGRWSSKELETG